MSQEIFLAYFFVYLSLWVGGVLKGATGVGAPIIAMPVIASIYDVRLAVVMMVFPNILTNIWQFISFKSHINWSGFIIAFVSAGVLGVLLGTWLLKELPVGVLSIIAALAIILYICARLLSKEWRINESRGRLLSFPAGLASGILQGATGVSAPASLTYLSSMRLDRPVFIASASLLFIVFGFVQLPVLLFAEIMSFKGAVMSFFAVFAISAGMPLGAAIGKKILPPKFDIVILVVLFFMAIKLLFDVFIS